MIPYTYHICWSKENLHYYGVRYAIGCHPDDLWVDYPTSSDRVKELKESLGDPDIIEVRKKFTTQTEARDWELRVLKRLGVTKRNDWLNGCAFPTMVWDDQQKENLSKARKKYWNDPINKEKHSKRMKGNVYASGNKGKKYFSWSDSRKKIKSDQAKKYYQNPVNREKSSERMKDLWKDPEYRKNQSEKHKGKAWSKARREAENTRKQKVK